MGAMIEVPALLWQLDDLLPEVDFISVGSNDLFQFLFAADRGNANVASRFDPLSLAGAAGAARDCANRASAMDVPLTLCGELAGRPIEAMALIGLGYRSISMSAASIGPVKAMVLELDAGSWKAMSSNGWKPATNPFARGCAISPKPTIYRSAEPRLWKRR